MLDRRQTIAPDQRLAAPGLDIAGRIPKEIWQVALWPAAALADKAVAMNLPDRPGQVLEAEGRVAMGLAPGRWLIEAEAGGRVPTVAPEDGSVTDLSHATVSLTVSGSDATALMQKLMPIDLSLARHAPGNVMRTGSGHSIGFTARRSHEDQYVLYIERSYAEDFWELLCLEAAEFGIR